MSLPRDLVAAIRRLDETQLRQLLILARGLLVTSEMPVLSLDDVPGMPSVSYRQRLRRCGKPNCSTCPHGPYWYAHYRQDGRSRTQYIGRELPADVARLVAERAAEVEDGRLRVV